MGPAGIEVGSVGVAKGPRRVYFLFIFLLSNYRKLGGMMVGLWLDLLVGNVGGDFGSLLAL